MSLFPFNIFTGLSFCCEAFLELRFWISVRNFLLLRNLCKKFVTGCSHTFLILAILGCLENFSMLAKTGFS